MFDAPTAPPDDLTDRSYAGWATKPRSVPGFIERRTRAAIIRSQSSLDGALLAVCGLCAAGLLVLALAMMLA
jgi:hypothetical protein